MVDHLRGRPAPALPVIPGRVHVLRDEPTTPDEWLEMTAAELARELGCTRQAAWQRQQRLRERHSNPDERNEP